MIFEVPYTCVMNFINVPIEVVYSKSKSENKYLTQGAFCWL